MLTLDQYINKFYEECSKIFTCPLNFILLTINFSPLIVLYCSLGSILNSNENKSLFATIIITPNSINVILNSVTITPNSITTVLNSIIATFDSITTVPNLVIALLKSVTKLQDYNAISKSTIKFQYCTTARKSIVVAYKIVAKLQDFYTTFTYILHKKYSYKKNIFFILIPFFIQSCLSHKI